VTDTLTAPAAAQIESRQHSERLTEAEAVYTVAVGGTVDGESMRDPVGYGNYGQSWENNLWTRLANVGDDVVVNPWIHVDGRRRWHSLAQILEDLLAEGMSDGEKARAIWEFARRHRYHSTTGDDEVKDTVKMLNVYGYTLCWDEAYTLSNLWQAAGLPIRRGLPHGHCTTEVFYDGAWHLLDSDEHLMVLDRDNETVVGEAEISRDHDLMKRSHTYGVLAKEDRRRAEDASSLFCHTGPRAGGRPRIGEHRMDLALRPGEALTWRWDERGRYHGYGKAPPRFCNGTWEWTPPLDAGFERWVEHSSGATHDTMGIALDSATWCLRTPYVVVGGSIAADTQGTATLSLSRGAGDWIDVGAVDGETRFELDDLFPHDADPTYDVRLRLEGEAVRLGHLAVELTLQMAPLSLPALRVGDNEIRYTDESAARLVEVTHAWRERDDLQAPAAPVPLSPVDDDGDGADESGTTPTLRWSDTAGPEGDYEVHLGTSRDVPLVLSPVFEKLVSRTPSAGQPQWTVPEEGLLNPGTTYWWRVRARSADGLWGPWSDSASFIPRAPGLPLDVHLDMDWERRRGTLRWRANPEGSAPVRFEVHGSDERGFSVSRDASTILSGDSDPEGERPVPATWLADVEGEEALVVGSGIDAGNRAFFRVVAVDADGRRSGPSDLAEAPRPFVYSALPTRVPAAQTTTVDLRAIHTFGDLRAESDGPHRYRKALRDGDVLDYILDEGPAFIALDAETGRLTLTPEAQHASTHTVTVRVRNGQGGVDVVGWDLEVIR
jgi:hypothetical protein